MGERVCMDTLSLKAAHHLFFAYTPPYMSSCRCCPCMNGRPSSTHHDLASLLLLDGASLLFDHAALQHLPLAFLRPELPHASPLQAITAAHPLATHTYGRPPSSLAAPQASPPQQRSDPSN
ncbi:hypothetical protein GOP47_0021246 [Adiantum capillus-veneris]|uniref:Uncharacterized protein n=1 Tax=Adiantum capillus-veneris TaxID=13818 RepID=A0A9D4UCJ6_ADICA|nr:hypothetical protein GOP47_0021243 [Adiantum capillus-veneris]KAI5064576.1 hypothetical protein GOP47_0021246 [Adiantum capillus-veneris]